MVHKIHSFFVAAIAFATLFVSNSAFADTDENGLTPKHWYKFNGNFNSSGETALTISGENGSNFFGGVNDQAMKVVDKSTHPWGSGVQYGNGVWSIVTVAKAKFKDSNPTVLWTTGTNSDGWFGLIAQNGGNSVVVAKGGSSGITESSLTANVNDTTAYHVYIIVYDGSSTLSLYVDGVLAATKTDFTKSTSGNFQWGAINGGLPDGLERVTDTGLDDWRLYQLALTPAQVKAITPTFILTPVAMWDKNFSANTPTTLGSGYTLNVNDNDKASDNTYLAVTKSDTTVGGLYFKSSDWTDTATENATIIFKVTDLSATIDDEFLISMHHTSSSDAANDPNGIYLGTGLVPKRVGGGNKKTDGVTMATGVTSLDTTATERILAFVWRKSGGMTLFETVGGTCKKICDVNNERSNIKFGGFTIGAAKASGGNMNAANGMKVHSLAVFNVALTIDQIDSFMFPSDKQPDPEIYTGKVISVNFNQRNVDGSIDNSKGSQETAVGTIPASGWTNSNCTDSNGQWCNLSSATCYTFGGNSESCSVKLYSKTSSASNYAIRNVGNYITGDTNANNCHYYLQSWMACKNPGAERADSWVNAEVPFECYDVYLYFSAHKSQAKDEDGSPTAAPSMYSFYVGGAYANITDKPSISGGAWYKGDGNADVAIAANDNEIWGDGSINTLSPGKNYVKLENLNGKFSLLAYHWGSGLAAVQFVERTKATATLNPADYPYGVTWSNIPWDNNIVPTARIPAEITVAEGGDGVLSFASTDGIVANGITFKGVGSVSIMADEGYNGGLITSELPISVVTVGEVIDIDAGANAITYQNNNSSTTVEPTLTTTGVLNITGSVFGAGPVSLANVTAGSIVIEKDAKASVSAKTLTNVSGAGTLIKTGSGTLGLNGGNAVNGTTVQIDAGTVTLNSDDSGATLTDVTFKMNGGNLGVYGWPTINGTLTIINENAVSILSKNFNGNAAIVKQGAGTLTFNAGTGNTSAYITAEAGTLILNKGDRANDVTVNALKVGAGTIQIQNNQSLVVLSELDLTNATSTPVTGEGTLNITGATIKFPATLAENTPVTLCTCTLSGATSGDAAFYIGDTLKFGKLIYDGNTVSYSGAQDCTVVTDAATLTAALTTGGNIVIDADITLTDTATMGADATINLNGHQISGGVIANGGNTLTFYVPGGQQKTINTQLTGTGAVHKTGAGTLTLACGSGNPFTGGFYADEGTSKATGNNKYGTTNNANTSKIYLGAGATIDLSNTANGSYWIISYGGTITNSSNDIGNTSRQLSGLTLNADTTITGNMFGLLADGYGGNTLALNNYTLTVQMNSGKLFYLCNTTITGAGKILVKSGKFGEDKSDKTCFTANDATIEVLSGAQLKTWWSGSSTIKNLILHSGCSVYDNHNLIVTGLIDVSDMTIADYKSDGGSKWLVGDNGDDNGNLTVKNTTTFKFPADAEAGVAYKLAGNTLNAESTSVKTYITVGDERKLATLTYDTTNKTVSFALVQIAKAKIDEGGATLNWNSTDTWEGGEIPTSGEVEIPAGAIVNVDTDIANCTIFGEGTVIYDNKYPGNEKASYQATTWTGTVWLKNNTASTQGHDGNYNTLHYNNYGNVGSKLKLTHVESYLNNNETIAPELILEDDGNNIAFKLIAGGNGNVSTISKLSGSGTFSNNYSNNHRVKILDVSDFTGSINDVNGKYFEIGNGSDCSTQKKLVIDAGYAANIAEGATWTFANGIQVKGTLSGQGTAAANVAFDAGSIFKATTAGKLTVNGNVTGTVAIDATALVEAGLNGAIAITASGTKSENVTCSTLGYEAYWNGNDLVVVKSTAKAFYARFNTANSVLTWRGSGDFTSADAKFVGFDLNTYEDSATILYSGANAWQRFASNQGVYTKPGNILRFDTPRSSTEGKFNFQVSPATFGGFMVEKGATGYSFNLNSGTRNTELGDVKDNAAKLWSVINEDFTIIRGSGSATIYGDYNLEVSESKCFHFNDNSTSLPTPTLANGASLKMYGGGVFSVNTLVASGATLDYSKLDPLRATPFINGNLTIDAATKIILPDDLEENTDFALCSGTLTGAWATGVYEITKGGETFYAKLTFNGNKIRFARFEVKKLTKDTAEVTASEINTEVPATADDELELTLTNEKVTLNVDVGFTVSKVHIVNATDLTINFTTDTFDQFAKFDFSKVTGKLAIYPVNKIGGYSAIIAPHATAMTYIYDATEGIADDATLRNRIRTGAGTDTFVFRGSGENGVALTYAVNVNAAIKSHIVFEGGRHTMSYGYSSSGDNKFGMNATDDNPTLLIKGGTILDFTAKDISYWAGQFSGDGVIRVNNGGTLNLKKSGSNTCYYHQRFYLEPGSLMTFDYEANKQLNLHGGTAENQAEIYVPASDEDMSDAPAIIRQLGQSGIYLESNQDTKGIAIFVGANSKLKVESSFDNNQLVAKYGAGDIEVTGAINTPFTINGGDLTLGGNKIGGLTLNADATITAAQNVTITSLTGNNHVLTSAGEGVLDITAASLPLSAKLGGGSFKVNLAGTDTHWIKIADVSTGTETEDFTIYNNAGEELSPVCVYNDALYFGNLEQQTLTDDQVAEVEALEDVTISVNFDTMSVSGAGITNLPEGYFAIFQGGKVYIAMNTESISLKTGTRLTANKDSAIKVTDTAVGGYPVAGTAWNNTRVWDHNADGGRFNEYLTLRNGKGEMTDVGVSYSAPCTYFAANCSTDSGNQRLTSTYLDDGSDAAATQYTINYAAPGVTIPDDMKTLPAAPNNRGWQFKISNIPYDIYELYIYVASDVTQDNLNAIPVVISCDGVNWKYYAGPKMGDDSSRWEAKSYSADGTLIEAKGNVRGHYIKFLISAASTGFSDVSTLHITHGTRNTGSSNRLGLAGIQIVKSNDDGVRMAAAAGNWHEIKWTLSDGTTEATWDDDMNYVASFNADNVASVTVDNEATKASKLLLTSTEATVFTINGTEESALTVDSGIDATGFKGALKLSGTINGNIALGSEAWYQIDVPANTTVRYADLPGYTITGSGTTKFVGSGILEFTEVPPTAIATAIRNSENWKGTVLIKGVTSTNWRFEDYVNTTTKSTVRLSGVKGYFQNGAHAVKLDLVDIVEDDVVTPAFESNNSSSGNIYTFDGLTGKGTFKATTVTSSGAAFVFKDVSLFTGTLRSVADGEGTYPIPIFVGTSGTAGSASGITFKDGVMINAADSTNLLKTDGALHFETTLKVFVADAPTGDNELTVMQTANSGLTAGELSVIPTVLAMGDYASGYYKLIAKEDGSIVLKASATPAERSVTIANSASLGAVDVEGYMYSLTGMGGVNMTSLNVANGILKLDPVLTPVKLNNAPTFISGAKIALDAKYADYTKGVFTLLMWDGETQIDSTILASLFDTTSAKGTNPTVTQVTYTVHEDSINGTAHTYTALKLDLNPSAEKTPLKIMPLGDSITEGSNSNGFGHSNYRQYLLAMLAAQGYDVKSTGFRKTWSQNAAGIWADENFCWHNGQSGERLITSGNRAGLQQSVNALIEASEVPDVIVLKIGTNDANTDGTDAALPTMSRAWLDVVKRIVAARPSTKIIACSIMDYTGVKGQTDENRWDKRWNARIEQLVNEGGFKENQVFFADLNAACPRYTGEIGSQTYTGNFLGESDLHPNWVGHAKNAQCLAAKIVEILPLEIEGNPQWTPNIKTGAQANVKPAYLADMQQLAVFDPYQALTKGEPVVYTTKATIPEGTKFSRIGYYLELKHKRTGHVRYVWADMDNWEPTGTFDYFEVPLNYQYTNKAVKNLHVDSNDSGIITIDTSDKSKTGKINFINSDNVGLMQVFEDGTTGVGTLFAFNNWLQTENCREIGIGDCALHSTPLAGGTQSVINSYRGTYNFEQLHLSTDTYDLASIEIWGKVKNTCTWIGGASGSWSDTNNWEDGKLPTEGDEVVIAVGENTKEVVVDAALPAVNSITVTGSGMFTITDTDEHPATPELIAAFNLSGFTGKTILNTTCVSGKAALYDWTFDTPNVDIVSRGQNTLGLNWDTGYNKSNGYVTDETKYTYGTALNTKATPYVDDSKSITYPTEWTCVVAGIVPSVNNAALIAFGTKGGGCIALLAGTMDDEVLIVRTTGNSSYGTPLATMTVPNARTQSHTYAFVKTATDITVYLDGSKWNVTPVSNATFGNKLQIGSLHGGKGDTGIESASGDTAGYTAIQAVRIFTGILGERALTAFATEFPYNCPYGTYSRTIPAATTTANWQEESAVWEKLGGEPETVPASKSVATLTANDASETTITINTTDNYEKLTFNGEGSMKFVKDANGNAITCNGATFVNVPVTIVEGAVKVDNGPVKLGDEGTITFDYANYPVDTIFGSGEILLTGVTDAPTGEKATWPVKCTLPTGDALKGRTMTFDYDTNIQKYVISYSIVRTEPMNLYVATDETLADGTYFATEEGGEAIAQRLLPNDTIIVPAGKTLTIPESGLKFPVISLQGAGTVVFDGYWPNATIQGQLKANTWTGMAWFKNFELGGQSFADLGATVQLTNVDGWMPNGVQNVTISLKDENGKAGFTLNDASPWPNYKYGFTKIVGDGTLVSSTVDLEGHRVDTALIVNDVSEFTGKLVSKNGSRIRGGEEQTTLARPICIGPTESASGSSESKILFANGVTVNAGCGWEAENVAFGDTLIVNGNVDDVLVTGVTTAPTAFPQIKTVDGQAANFRLVYDEENGNITLKKLLDAEVEGDVGYNYAGISVDVDITTIGDDDLKFIKVIAKNPASEDVVSTLEIDGPGSYVVPVEGLIPGWDYTYEVQVLGADGTVKIANLASGDITLGNSAPFFSADATSGESEVEGGEWTVEPQIVNNAYQIGESDSVFTVSAKGDGNKNVLDIQISFDSDDFTTKIDPVEDTPPKAGITVDSTTEGGYVWNVVDNGEFVATTTVVTMPGSYTIRTVFDYAAGTVRYLVSADGGESFTTLKDSTGKCDFTLADGMTTISSVSFSGESQLAKFGAASVDTYLASVGGTKYATMAAALDAAGTDKTVTLLTNIDLNAEGITAGSYNIAKDSNKFRWTDGTTDDGRIIVYDATNSKFVIKEMKPKNGIDSFTSYVLQLDPEDSTTKPIGDAPADNGKEDTLTVEIKTLNGDPLTPREGYTVKYVANPTMEGKGEKIISTTPEIDLPLPTSGEVKYTITVEVVK